MAAATALQPLLNSISSPLVQLLLLSVPVSFAVFVLAVLSHADGRAYGASRARPDLEVVPGAWPLLGNLLQVAKTGDRQLEEWVRMRRAQKDQSKNLTVSIPFIRIIDCTSPQAIEYIQKTNFSNYVKGPLFGDVMNDILGEGIFAVDGEKWTVQRKATSKIFNGNNFRGIITTSLANDITKLQSIIGRHADKGEAFDLGALFFAFTLSSFTSMAFSQDIGALSLDTDAPVPFAAAFDYAQGQMARRFNNPFWRITERFSSEGRKMKEAAKILDDFAYGIIKQREEQGLGNFTGDKKVAESTDLLSLYMALRDENGQPMSRQALRDSVLNLIIAGRDTTAQALSWTFFHLMSQPDLVKPLRAEVDQVGVVDYDSFKTLKETLAVFNEGLRLHPSVPKNAWQALADDQIPGGPFVKAGDLVRWSDWEMGRSEEVWGPDAWDFKPSRWIDTEGKLKKETQWVAHWFNGGYRLCLGQNLATYEATVVMATIIKDFDLTFAPGYLENVEMIDCEKTPRYQDSLTLPLHAPLMVTAARRMGS